MTMLACAILSIGAASAQNTKTYTGFVVDKNGNPVVGAEVMAPGGGATTITDSDGSFNIEVPFMLKKLTASYTGMRDETLKLGNSSNLVFKMKGLKKMTGFISVIGDVGISFDTDVYSSNYKQPLVGGGIMGGQLGQLGKWGWYTKGMAYLATYDLYVAGILTAGAIRKLGSKAHIYLGAGGACVYDGLGYSVDLGTIFNVSDHVNVIAGLNYVNSHISYRSATYRNLNLNIGAGYTF